MWDARVEVEGIAGLQDEFVDSDLPLDAPRQDVEHFFAFVLEEDELVDLVRKGE
jgi:hypothetical protein